MYKFHLQNQKLLSNQLMKFKQALGCLQKLLLLQKGCLIISFFHSFCHCSRSN
ncbi:hypothetical protein M23134_02575 [Microscilla marina ATCC 23134]|uniref:Uncharacterized protein n=1 Tax=Microscilla marina ATCC 23134 TaxID=313606 RepID=A1ZNM9_MICM2|nr:hypothetical protein M23134_02575 [Microscilla marina ATCC 23134]